MTTLSPVTVPVTVPPIPGDLRAVPQPHSTDRSVWQDVCGCPVSAEPAALGLGGPAGPLWGAQREPPAPTS